MTMIINENNIGNYVVPPQTRDGIAVDIGANVGLFSANHSSFFRTIHTYEPITVLAEKIKVRDIPNITIFNEAVGATTGKAKMILHRGMDSGSTTTEDCLKDVITVFGDTWSDTVICEVPMIDLETVIDRVGGRIDYLKMDCETSEYPILMNKDLSNIGYIGIELHGQMGIDHWNELGTWISRTHDGFPPYTQNNTECLLTPKSGV
jgi:FkbM family methyltransferase